MHTLFLFFLSYLYSTDRLLLILTDLELFLRDISYTWALGQTVCAGDKQNEDDYLLVVIPDCVIPEIAIQFAYSISELSCSNKLSSTFRERCLHLKITCHSPRLGLARRPALRPSLRSASVCLFVCGCVLHCSTEAFVHGVFVCVCVLCAQCVHFCVICIPVPTGKRDNINSPLHENTWREEWLTCVCSCCVWGLSHVDPAAVSFLRSLCLPLRRSFDCAVNI